MDLNDISIVFSASALALSIAVVLKNRREEKIAKSNLQKRKEAAARQLWSDVISTAKFKSIVRNAMIERNVSMDKTQIELHDIDCDYYWGFEGYHEFESSIDEITHPYTKFCISSIILQRKMRFPHLQISYTKISEDEYPETPKDIDI